MADFDSLFADNLRDFQPVMMHNQYTSRDNVGRARSSGSLDRAGRSSSASIKSQQRASSLQSHRRQNSAGGASAVNFAGHDPFSEISMSEIWVDHNGSPNGSPGPAETIPLQSDQLLSFRTYHRNNVMLLDALGQHVTMSMAAQLHGMFFLAESPWDASGGPAVAGAPTPKELTCYRRNLFQVSGSILLPNVHSVIIGDGDNEVSLENLASGQRRMIQSLEATISGIENVEHSPVKIITVPWKNAATAPASQPTQPPPPVNDDYPPTANNTGRALEKEPAPLLFNYPPAYYANPAGIPPDDDDGDAFKWQLNWKRLQFRSATANNGRRKDLQQHFMVKLSVYATLFSEDMQPTPNEKLDKVLLCEAFSNAIIVRGRSPRNFSSRNDIPLTGSAIVSSRHTHSNNMNAQMMSSAAKKARHMSASSADDEKPDLIYPPDFASQYSSDYLLDQSNPLQQMQNDLNFASDIYGSQVNWMDPSSSIPLLQSQPQLMQQQFFEPGASYSSMADPTGGSRVNLTGLMYGDEYTPTTQSIYSGHTPPVTTMEASMPPPSITHRATASKFSSAQSPSMDLLYEYFPIGIDDFLPPVEVVYRPHNAHHQTQLPPSKTSTRSKRLFSETPFE
ncbi:hypothetical protein DRE_04575 [Drechslerella stenobrocha 248]|uniref:NDT80 domain-containing protein n=1 Tax=Drechslerella stenobrocha 248 TaxID=1043628 RepID=W7I104_9PEZI|nr:hypothetical protein DRE_04575 [Drechslerella stenobrocha 248]